MGASQWVHVEVERIKRETPHAFLVVLEDREVWLPKSHISCPDTYEEGDKDVTLSITQWIANQKEIETED